MQNQSLIILIVFFTACSTPTKNGDIKIGPSNGCWKSDYTPAEQSEYVLPYPVGKEYYISQGNCGTYTHIRSAVFQGIDFGDNRYAYDFSLHTGSEIVASRGGQVINIDESHKYFRDNVLKGNFIMIRHNDGTGAFYGHLDHKGVLVEVGDMVNQGDAIGISGKTGYTYGIPHLHFAVFEGESNNCDATGFDQSDISSIRLSECKSIPITFKNAEPLDTPPIVEKFYKAVEY